MPALYLTELRSVVFFYGLTNRSSGVCGSTSAASSFWMCFMVQTLSIRMKMRRFAKAGAHASKKPVGVHLLVTLIPVSKYAQSIFDSQELEVLALPVTGRR